MRIDGAKPAVAGLAAALVLIPFCLLLVVARAPADGLDARAAAELHAYALAHPGVTRLLIVWTNVFGPWPWRVAVVAYAVWLFRRGATRPAVWAVTTMAVGGLLGAALKLVVARARPLLPDPVALAEGHAFPSGHALNVTLGAGVILLLALPALSRRGRRAAWAATCFLVLSVGYTRIALGVHWVSDVVAGISLGLAMIAATLAGLARWPRDRRPVEPRPARKVGTR
ncbi:phosphatase PAP2 family protein [Nonomuraea phyllanthi]|uniref:phosphatase PAP2 family protein n=1 Tax=Nonomuraea phyllanthi TaxID=2219224 RepID=UPI001293CB7E|nr:phosphatase PAP2 family protein [Nonomuraea phyllanthi]QFY07616.1 phosphatase PAP2 family protein [Nonomuraea phyllanthi]